MFTSLVSQLVLICTCIVSVQSLCGESIRWSHKFDIDDILGFWYGVGYAQHTPDMTNEPNEVGCVSVYITDDLNEVREDWRDWSILRKNHSDHDWLSYRNNPWSDTYMSGSWLDIPIRVKRAYEQRRLRVIWDEDGQTMEQTYVYAVEDPGIWTVEKWRPGEKEMLARGIDIWYPDDTPKHLEVIRILKATPNTLILNHCTEVGNGGVISLILRRSFKRVERWEWYDFQRQFYSFELPNLYRLTAICSGCVQVSSVLCILICFTILIIVNKRI